MTKLADYIARNGLTQAAFAGRIGVAQPMVSDWSSGRRRPGLTNALAIERATGGAVPASYWTGVAVVTAPRVRERRRPRRSTRRVVNQD